MKIERIDKLHDCGVFRDFTWGDDPDLYDFSCFNLIYGWNGSGKSTISRILRSLELRIAPPSGDVTVRLPGRKVDRSEFEELSPETIALKVFNQEFVKENVFRPDNGDIAPILVLGAQSIDAQQKIDALRADLEEVNHSLETSVTRARELTRGLEKHSQPNARTLKDTIGLRADSAYHNYDRRPYERRADLMIREGEAESFILSEEDRTRLMDHQAETLRSSIEFPAYETVDLDALVSHASDLLAKTVTSKAISSLAVDPTLAAWIHRGLEIHSERSTDGCLYCSQSMPADRLKTLNDHFDEAHQELIGDLEAEIELCESSINEMRSLQPKLPVPEQLYAHLSTAFREARDEVHEELKHVHSFLDSLKQVLDGKRGRVFEPISFKQAAPSNGATRLAQLAALVETHNNECAEFQAGVESARESLEADFIAKRLEEYREIKAAIELNRVRNAEARDRATEMRSTIAELERDVLDHRPPADDLNADLRAYLGAGALQLQVNDHGYTLVREGRPAVDPSEGEMTAIALLYFLMTFDSSGFNLGRGVVVLDDPVSSLDDNALFTAASFIRRRTEGAGQLIILTHNFTFFREMRNWFRHLPKQGRKDPAKRPAQFYMLRCYVQGGVRHSRLRTLDRLLAQYESDYHYLFSRIHRAAKTPSDDLEDNYALPNMARRLLEAFLALQATAIGHALGEGK